MPDRVSAHFSGYPGAGKTVAMAMLSEQWPKNYQSRTPKSKTIWLEDIAWASWDRTALAGLMIWNIRVRHEYKAHAKLAELGGPLNVQNDLLEWYGGVLDKNKKVIGLATDSLSTMAAEVEGWWFLDENVLRSKSQKPDGKRTWGVIRQQHIHFASALQEFGNVMLLYSFHLKNAYMGEDQDAKLQAAIKKLGQEAVMVPDFSGSGLTFFTAHAAIEYGMSVKRVASKKKGEPDKFVYTMHTETARFGEYEDVQQPFRTKNRLRGLVPFTIPPEDLRGYFKQVDWL